MNIYLKNGFLNMRVIINIPVPFIFVIGARGIGKTYGMIKTCIEDGNRFILMRRTQLQADLISKPDFCPLKSPCADLRFDYKILPVSKQCSAVFRLEGEEIAEHTPFCYSVALSTFSNLRGFDANNVDLLFYDEFIPEKHERPMKEEGDAFLNCYETINRNRELQGREPLKCVCCANSNSLVNPIFVKLGLVSIAEKMKNKRKQIYINKERGLAIINCEQSPISKAKEETALYKLAGKYSAFSKMALGNEFAGDIAGRVESRPLKEYTVIAVIGELSIYKHKSRQEYYVCAHCSGTPLHTFSTSDSDKLRFRRLYNWLWSEYMKDTVIFESYLFESLFLNIFT